MTVSAEIKRLGYLVNLEKNSSSKLLKRVKVGPDEYKPAATNCKSY